MYAMAMFVLSNTAFASCETWGKVHIPYDEETRSLEYFERTFDEDLSEVGRKEDYPGIDGFYVAVAEKVGLIDIVKAYVSENWPDIKPAAMIRYSDECWLFFLFKFDLESRDFSWKRFLKVTHGGEIYDLGAVGPDDM